MIKTIADTIEWLAHERYDPNPSKYHYDYKIALYSVYMEVMEEVGDKLKLEAEKERREKYVRKM